MIESVFSIVITNEKTSAFRLLLRPEKKLLIIKVSMFRKKTLNYLGRSKAVKFKTSKRNIINSFVCVLFETMFSF